MLIAIASTRPSQLMVMAYDITCQRRAKKVRQILDAVNHAKQYSVYEAMLTHREADRLRSAVSACCDPATDVLAAWKPVDGMRLVWNHNELHIEAQAGGVCGKPAHLRANIGNFMLCYDISTAATLRAVSAEIAAESAMVQRSVYWLRASTTHLTALLKRCASHLNAGDRLWAYPMNSSRDLWQVGERAAQSILPIATHHW
jgi:CRISPR/Cas system-associated endoribonuclease Cas2